MDYFNRLAGASSIAVAPAAECACSGVAPHNQHLSAAWNAALVEYQDAGERAREETHTDEHAVAVCDTAAAFYRLVDTRVPDLEALREKVRIIRAELGRLPERVLTQLLADIDRLS